jgi:hypothetical protein
MQSKIPVQIKITHERHAMYAVGIAFPRDRFAYCLLGWLGHSNQESIQNQHSKRHRSLRGVLLRVPGRMSGHERLGGRCQSNGVRRQGSRLETCPQQA